MNALQDMPVLTLYTVCKNVKGVVHFSSFLYQIQLSELCELKG